ncbi:MAG: cyclase family protein [Actinobacteria bacterium]|nr:cyclase family protein [Actinomycetota bacterium]
MNEPSPQYHDALSTIDASSVMASLRLPSEGRIYSLDSGWWNGMPMLPIHPQFNVLTYRSPRGFRNQGDQDFLKPENNREGYSFISELILGSAHSGTHIDAIGHITCGADNSYYGGGSTDEKLGDFGLLESDAAQLAPIIARGVMIDVPALLGVDSLEAHHGVDGAELQAAVERQGSEVRKGDVALLRTGQMFHWPDEEALAAVTGSGLSLDGARWLTERGVIAVGGDTVALECSPSGIEGTPQPVHIHLIHERGIPILEWVNCEELARDGVYEFLFVCLPLGIGGATGSMVRPIAIV